jgi:hypothetical protein
VRERFIRGVFTRMLNGLREVHAHKLLHLDIKPSNIYLRADGTPVLLDFGAARQTLLSDTPILKPMYTPGFASPEQFHSRDALGPWSDIYSVGASMYACLAGSSPQRSDERVKHDNVVPATKAWAGQYSPHFLATIDWCLQLDPLKRPQSCFALQKVLAQRHREAPPQQKTWLEGLGSRLKTMIGRT